jgi:hypothetical protein
MKNVGRWSLANSSLRFFASEWAGHNPAQYRPKIFFFQLFTNLATMPVYLYLIQKSL